MIPLAIRRHNLQDLTLGQSTLLKVPACEERQALYNHDIEIGKGASQWMINLRASVRPVVTYIFVLELVALNVAGVWYAYTTGIPFAIAMENVFSDDEMAILASIIAFHFGGRAFSQK